MIDLKFNDEILDLDGRHIRPARIISRLTPAPIFNIYIALVIVVASPNDLGPILNPVTAFLICLCLMVVAPILPIVYNAWKGHVDLDVSVRDHRTKFFLYSLICYALAYGLYAWFYCDIFRVLAAAYLMVTTAVMLLTFKTKVSVHAAGVGGPSTALIYMYGMVAIPVIVIWFVVVWSRSVLKQHTLIQGALGIMVGFVVTLTTYILLCSG
ncbi:MAG: hypothetical protein K9W43_04145 [Candidatus Thorarchaeota archaeon]|nr:hypothetical protein [Candidatus Thorarchaeota archaeon]